MTYEFAKYPDGTLGVFSNIGEKENGEHNYSCSNLYLRVCQYQYVNLILNLIIHKKENVIITKELRIN